MEAVRMGVPWPLWWWDGEGKEAVAAGGRVSPELRICGQRGRGEGEEKDRRRYRAEGEEGTC